MRTVIGWIPLIARLIMGSAIAVFWFLHSMSVIAIAAMPFVYFIPRWLSNLGGSFGHFFNDFVVSSWGNAWQFGALVFVFVYILLSVFSGFYGLRNSARRALRGRKKSGATS